VLDSSEIAFPHAVHGGAVEFRLTANDVGPFWKALEMRETLDVQSHWIAGVSTRELQEVTFLQNEHAFAPFGKAVGQRAAAQSRPDNYRLVSPSPL
jgi:hypothetical protein